MSKVFSFPNLATPVGKAHASLEEAVNAGQAAVNGSGPTVRGMAKNARREHLKLATTVWPCITLTEGVNQSLRVSKDNPPQLLHGFIADYDNVGKRFTIEELTQHAARCAYPPAAAGASLSGDGVHAVWLFKEPIPLLGDADYARRVTQACYSKLRVGNFMQGFDSAFKTPDRLLSIDPQNFGWVTPLGEQQVVDEVSTRMWAGAVTTDFKFEGPELDVEKVYEQVEKLFPGRWAGPFVVGARGVRFWDSTASDPTAAVVTSSGMVYFSDGGGFKPWSAILGQDVAARLSADSLRELSSNWYYDDSKKEYVWYNAGHDGYQCKTRAQFFDRLTLAGIEDEVEKKRAIVYVEDHKSVAGVVALANQKRGLIKHGGATYLNSSQTVHVKPVPGPHEFILGLHKVMFGPGQFDIVMAWLRDSVDCMMQLEPSYAQALFMAGNVSCGKSLLQYKVWTPLFGGKSANPMPYLLKEVSFNSELADAGHWLVSDEEGAKNSSQRASFTQKIKAIAANPEMSVHPKYKTPVTLMLNSRISFSFNKTDECMGVIPRLGSDIMDKFILVDVHDHDYFTGLDRRVIESTIVEELPGFANWLLNEYVVPESVKSVSGRYRTKSYQAPSLMSSAKACQDSAELLGWISVLFSQNETLKTDFWDKGQPADFIASRWLQLITQTCGSNFGLTPNRLATHFQNLARQFPGAIHRYYDSHDKLHHFVVNYKQLLELEGDKVCQPQNHATSRPVDLVAG